MSHSVEDMKRLITTQFATHAGTSVFKSIHENIQTTSFDMISRVETPRPSVDITFVIPESREIWQIVALGVGSGKWKCEAYAFIGSIELTTKQEQTLEKSFNTVWQDAPSDRDSENDLEESLSKNYSLFNKEQLELLMKINPVTPNGVSFTPCQNSNANIRNWWIRAELEAKDIDLEAVFKAGRTSIASMRKKLDSLKLEYSMEGFEYYMQGDN